MTVFRLQFRTITLLLALMLAIGCGSENVVTQSTPAPDLPGTYSSAEEAIAVIRARTGMDKPADVPPALLAPVPGNYGVIRYIQAATGGRLSPAIPGATDRIVLGIPPGAMDTDKRIAMMVYVKTTDVDLVVEFGPTGTVFDPYAMLQVPFQFLEDYAIENMTITVESGDTIEEVSYGIDWDRERLIAYVPHFSQYRFPRP